MLNADQYETFAQLLNQRDVVLRTDPSRYRKAHELPGWALTLQPVTAETVWTVGADLSAFEQACIRLERGPAVLRDYTKSLKHHWDEAMFIADVSDLPKARRTATRFLDLRGEDFAGGLVLRRFETFVGPELRTWWIDGRLELVTNHPDTADDAPAVVPKLQRVAPLVAALELRFVTVDVTRHRDGTWWVIELGDGQVSDLPRSTDPERLLHALALGTAAPGTDTAAPATDGTTGRVHSDDYSRSPARPIQERLWPLWTRSARSFGDGTWRATPVPESGRDRRRAVHSTASLHRIGGLWRWWPPLASH